LSALAQQVVVQQVLPFLPALLPVLLLLFLRLVRQPFLQQRPFLLLVLRLWTPFLPLFLLLALLLPFLRLVRLW
jgi:hypothetical protein